MAKFTNPFGELQLSLADERSLEEIAYQLVHETLEKYETHLNQNRSQVNTDTWKFVKRREDVSVFVERRQVAASDLPVLMATGTIVGDLDDVMYGVANETQDAMRLKTSYVEDHLVDASVLATIAKPTVADPFRVLCVKWAVKGRPLHIRSIIRNRDLVYLESTGVAPLSNGERIGFQLLHSVEFPQVPAIDSAVRGNMSICCLYRQHSSKTVELYMKGFLDPAGGIMRAIVVQSAAEVMVSVWKNVYCAQMKKLAWAIRRSDKGASSQHSVVLRTQQDSCASCDKRSLMPKLSGGAHCRLCLQFVCSSCKLVKKLSFISPDRRLMQQRITFCVLCLTEATNKSAMAIASDEVQFKDRDMFGLSMQSTTSSSQSHQSRRWSRASSDASLM